MYTRSTLHTRIEKKEEKKERKEEKKRKIEREIKKKNLGFVHSVFQKSCTIAWKVYLSNLVANLVSPIYLHQEIDDFGVAGLASVHVRYSRVFTP